MVRVGSISEDIRLKILKCQCPLKYALLLQSRKLSKDVLITTISLLVEDFHVCNLLCPSSCMLWKVLHN